MVDKHGAELMKKPRRKKMELHKGVPSLLPLHNLQHYYVVWYPSGLSSTHILWPWYDELSSHKVYVLRGHGSLNPGPPFSMCQEPANLACTREIGSGMGWLLMGMHSLREREKESMVAFSPIPQN